MKLKTVMPGGICLLISTMLFSQQPDTLIQKLDSLNKRTDTTAQKNIITPKAYTENTGFTFSSYFILLGSDLKQDITAPFHQTRKEWLRIGGFAVATAAVSLLDEPVQRFAVKLHDSSEAISGSSKYITRFGEVYELYTLTALATYGFVFHNKKIETTALLASQAYITGEAMSRIVKFIAGRQRPSVYVPAHSEPEPTFHGPFHSMGKDINGQRTNSSFPSGHTTDAFAAATVFSMEYKKPWVSILSYSAASLVGLSRITENKHWTSDVFAGAVLGYLCGRQVVNNYHRYAKLRSRSATKGFLSFNFQYNNRQIIPGAIYTFR